MSQSPGTIPQMDNKLLDIPTMRETLRRIAAAGGTMMLSCRPCYSPANLVAASASRRALANNYTDEEQLVASAYMALERVELDAARQRAGAR